MISHISIKDFAIIEGAEIDFYPGLNIVTGETGAGKSIVIEAVSLALGSRADTAFVRSGKEKAVIQLAAELGEEEYVITREISAAGKNLCKINGEIVTLSQVSALCKKIADIHGQYDHQSLLNPDYHIRLVDAYQSDKISPVKETVAELHNAYTTAKHKLSTLLSGAAENQRQRDFMRFELDEINQANLKPGEEEALTEEISLLQNSEQIYSSLSESYELAYGSEPSAVDNLDKALKRLCEVDNFSTELAAISTEFSDLFYKLQDLCQEIRHQRDKVVFSPEELDSCLSRMDFIDTLKRKYGGTIEKILNHGQELEEKLNLIETIDTTRETLEKEVRIYEEKLSVASAQLSQLRQRSATLLEKKIEIELRELNFKDATLSIHFDCNPQRFTETGTDLVEFLISANKGEPLKPLSKIASGGEMSRIMLAFKNIIAAYDRIPTMIFDEIDTGISGITAAIVGKKMKEIAKEHQIICITHLPQIAAFGDHNYRISKATERDSTYTTISPLSREEKVDEIARLLGGINITQAALENAKELIEQSLSS